MNKFVFISESNSVQIKERKETLKENEVEFSLNIFYQLSEMENFT